MTNTPNTITLIEIYFNGAKVKHVFKGDVEENFLEQVAAIGYFTEKDIDGRTVIINPSNCGSIEIIKPYIN